jgi:hypothetical protein
MRKLLLLVVLHSAPSFASESVKCSEANKQLLREGNSSISIMVITKYQSLMDMHDELSRIHDTVGSPSYFNILANNEKSGKYEALTQMYRYVNTEIEALKPCTEIILQKEKQ